MLTSFLHKYSCCTKVMYIKIHCKNKIGNCYKQGGFPTNKGEYS